MKIKIRRPSFIGMLSDEEATEARRINDDWSKRFNESFEERRKLLTKHIKE